MEPVETSQLLRRNCVVEWIGDRRIALTEWIPAADAYLPAVCLDSFDENIWSADVRSES